MGGNVRAKPPRRRAHRLAVAGGVLLALAGAGPARAQFFFWDQPRYSPDDAARIAMSHGFRPMARPERNDKVYLADVIDQRGRQERLIISADTGEILQRFLFDDGRRFRRFADPSLPRGPVPPGRIPDEDSRQYSRLAPEDGDEPALDRPAPPPRQRTSRPRRRVGDTGADTVHQTPVESAPLAPPAAAPAPLQPAPAAPAAPAQAALPAATATASPASPLPAPVQPTPAPAPDKPGRAISRDPLAIPGSREDDARKATAAKDKPADKAEGRPAASPAAKPPVVVAPLD